MQMLNADTVSLRVDRWPWANVVKQYSLLHVSSFVDSSARHRGMRPNLVAMKTKTSSKPKFKPGSSYLARVLKLVNQCTMHNASSAGTTPRECSTKHKVMDQNTQSVDSTVSSFMDSIGMPIIHVRVSCHLGKRRYLILKSGCLYYYKDDSASSAQGQFSLEGYR